MIIPNGSDPNHQLDGFSEENGVRKPIKTDF